MTWGQDVSAGPVGEHGEAQVADARQLREVAGRWAEYYFAVYRVPLELVEAIIGNQAPKLSVQGILDLS